MKKFLIFTTALFLASTFFSCKKDLVDLEECGIQLRIDHELLENGLTVDSYGTDMAIYPLAIIGFSYPQVVQNLYNQASVQWGDLLTEEDQQAFYEDFRQQLASHHKIIGELAVIPTSEYKKMVENPMEGYEFIIEMQVIKEKYGNTYLFSKIENNTDGMDEEELKIFEECQKETFEAIKKAKFKKLKVEAFDPEKYSSTGTNGGVHFPMFASMDLDGNSTTEKIFSQKDLTLLILWNVDSDKIQEVKDLIDWSKKLPDMIQTVGILCDVNSPSDEGKINKAKEVCEGKIQNILGAGDLMSLGEYFVNLPTVLLVDSDGDMWGDAIENAVPDECASSVAQWIQADEYLKSLVD